MDARTSSAAPFFPVRSEQTAYPGQHDDAITVLDRLRMEQCGLLVENFSDPRLMFGVLRSIFNPDALTEFLDHVAERLQRTDPKRYQVLALTLPDPLSIGAALSVIAELGSWKEYVRRTMERMGCHTSVSALHAETCTAFERTTDRTGIQHRLGPSRVVQRSPQADAKGSASAMLRRKSNTMR